MLTVTEKLKDRNSKALKKTFTKAQKINWITMVDERN